MKNTSIFTLCLLIIFTASISFGQKARPRSNASKPKTTIKAKGTIELEAGLLFNSGDTKPVVRATFYLLKENPEKIVVTQENLDIYNKDRAGSSIIGRETLSGFGLLGAALAMDGQLAPNFAIAAKKSLQTSSTASGTTGFDGKATMTSVPTGDYYLFGYYRFGGQTIYWNIPVSVKTGVNKIVLDNNNAE
jgi:hypothetical protein